MAKQGGADLARAVVSGSFTATGQSGGFRVAPGGEFNISLTGTAVASVQLERSFDEGVTWCALYAGGVQLYVWSFSSTNLSEIAEEPERGVLYRLNCTAYTSGTLNYRLSQ